MLCAIYTTSRPHDLTTSRPQCRLWLVAMVFLLCCNLTFGQTKPPTKTWHFSQDNGTLSEDWLYEVIETTDEYYVAAGFSGPDASKSPSIIKTDINGNVKWHKVYVDNGRFQDITENSAGNYVAFGYRDAPGEERKGFLQEYAPNGALLTTKIYDGNDLILWSDDNALSDDTRVEGRSVRQTADGGYILSCYLSLSVSGSAARAYTGTVCMIKLNAVFSVEWVYQNYDFENQLTYTSPRCAREILDASGNSKGFIVTGEIGKKVSMGTAPSGWPRNGTDVYVMTIKEKTGVPYWEVVDQMAINSEGTPATTYDTSDTEPDVYTNTIFSATNTYPTIPTQSYCTPTTPTETDLGWHLEQLSNGDVVIAALFRQAALSSAGCDYDGVGGSAAKEHLEGDGFLVKLSFADLDSLNLMDAADDLDDDLTMTGPNFVARLSGVDFVPRVKETLDGALALFGTYADNYDSGGNPLTPTVSAPFMSLTKTDVNLNVLWNKKYRGPSQGTCGFGFSPTNDLGFITVGNNAQNTDDYVMIKLYSDCHPNANYFSLFQPGTVFDIPSGTQAFFGDLVIGGTVNVYGYLEIIDATIEFADTRQLYDFDELATNTGIVRSGIIVHPGGELKLRGTTLKGLDECSENNMWEGIQVRGIPTAVQDYTLPPASQPQGFARVQIGSVIQDALTGIRNGGIQYNSEGFPEYDFTHAGGIIRGSQADFVNNLVSVELGGHVDENFQQDFLDHDFICNNYLADPNFRDADYDRAGSEVFVKLSASGKPHFRTCRFTNTHTAHYTIGIHAVQSVLAAYSNSEFHHLKEAIYVTNAPDLHLFTARTIRIDNSTFTDNGYAALIYSPNSVPVIFGSPTLPNTVDIPASSGSFYGYGVYLNGCRRFDIEGNHFTGPNPGTVFDGHGIIATHTGNHNVNMIANNRLEGLTVATLALGDNGQALPTNNSGVQIDCNEFETNWIDMAVLDDIVGSGGVGSLPNQGSSSDPASNSLTDVCSPGGGSNITHIFTSVNANAFDYYHHDAPADFEPTCLDNNYAANPFNTGITYDQPLHCPDLPVFTQQMGKVNNLAMLMAMMDNLAEQMTPSSNASETAHLAMKRQYLLQHLADYYAENGQQMDLLDLLRAEVESHPSLAYRLFDELLIAQEYKEASEVLANLPQAELADQLYIDVQNIRLNLAQNDLDYTNMSEQQSETLYAIAETGTPASRDAQAILRYAFDADFPIVHPQLPIAFTNKTLWQLEEEKLLRVFPNPANTSIMLQLSGQKEYDQLQIVLQNAMGVVLKQEKFEIEDNAAFEMDISALPKGLYLLEVKNNKESTIATEKLLIVR